MLGTHCTLPDIVLEELPCPVDLQCHEKLEEEEEQGDLFKVQTGCGLCHRKLKVVVKASCTQTLRLLQQLLLEDLDFICPPCGLKHK
ncbi:E7 protein [Pudu puda papillomavirus 1]|uniref:Protein E7 n=1 Tax=Pudu puda papillomavirus 1 TaxID=1747360 RepID=A0A1I9KHZ4_9PAPI|nr:E7 protein [Pudu puda papillomavirus 1]ALP46952.1 E7 protein [Pudu puda papillomavirus 1]